MRRLAVAAALLHLVFQPHRGQALLAARSGEAQARPIERDRDRSFGLKRPTQLTPWLGRKGKALVVLSHWIPGDGKNGSGRAREKVEKSLNGTLGEIRSWAVESTIVLVTNEYNPNVSSMVSHQIVTGRDPWCNATFQFKLCMPWEALKALRNASAAWEPGCDLYKTAACGVPRYDYYVYSESDIKAPKETFEFWATHVEGLHQRGYLLMPHREEHFGSEQVLTDCYDQDCINRTAIYKDEGPSMYSDSRDRLYVLPGNPYTGCFFMTREMYSEWLESSLWDYSHAMLLSRPPVGNIKSWGKRESATGGLLWDPRYGMSKGLTHLKMKVFHASHMHRVSFTEKDYHRVAEVQALVDQCADGALSNARCHKLS